jgi:hypothetical protein
VIEHRICTRIVSFEELEVVKFIVVVSDLPTVSKVRYEPFRGTNVGLIEGSVPHYTVTVDINVVRSYSILGYMQDIGRQTTTNQRENTVRLRGLVPS